MTEKIIETGWNLDNSYARSAKIIFYQPQPNPCTLTEVDHSQ